MRALSLLSALLATAHATSTIERREPDPQGDPWGEEPTTGISPLPASAAAGSGVLSPSGPNDMSNMGAMAPPTSGSGGGGPNTAGTPKPFKEALADLYGFLPVARVAKTVELKPALSPANKRAKITFGPFTLPERGSTAPLDSLLPSMDDDGVAFLSILKGGICSNCTILAGHTGLELANGTKADYNNGLYIHHLLMADISKPMNLPVSVCDTATRPGTAHRQNQFARLNGMLGSGFLGTGDNIGSSSTLFTTPDASYKSGYFIGKKDDFAITFDLVNENPRKQDVYVALDLEWVDGHVGDDAGKMVLSVAGCNLNPVKLNATGIANTVSRGYDVLLDADLVFAKGQMHEGGDRMGLYLNGAKVCESVAKYGADDKGRVITEMTACEKPIPVKKGDRLALESVYDLGKRKLRRADEALIGDTKGGYPTMGMWELTFAIKEANRQPW